MKKQIYIYPGESYEVKETGHILKNMGRIKGTPNFRIKYQDEDKDDLILNGEQVKYNLKFCWVKKSQTETTI